MTATEAPGASRPAAAAIARGGLANLAGAAISAVANLVLVVAVARAVPTDVAGRFFAATSAFIVLETACRLGTDTSTIYFIARWKALGDVDRTRWCLRLAVRPTVLLSTLAAAVVVVLAPELTRLIGDDTGASVTLLRTLALFLPVAVAYDVIISATRGFAVMRPTVLIDKIGRPCFQLLLVALVIAFGLDRSLGIAWAAPFVVALAGAWIALRKLLPVVGNRRPDRAAMTEFWKFSIPRAVAGFAQIGLQRADIVLMAALRGVAAAAIYTAATRFLVVGQFINQAISAPLQPRLSAALSTGQHSHARDLYRLTTTWLVLASWPVFGIAIALADVYLDVFGGHYASGRSTVIVLSLAMLLATAVGPVDNVIIMAGRASWNLWTAVGALVVNIGLNFILIPEYGLLGAALAWCAGIVVSNLIPLALAWFRLRLHPFGASTYRAYVVAGLCCIVVPLAVYWAAGASGFAAITGVTIGVLAYGACVWHWRTAFELNGAMRLRRPARPREAT